MNPLESLSRRVTKPPRKKGTPCCTTCGKAVAVCVCVKPARVNPLGRALTAERPKSCCASCGGDEPCGCQLPQKPRCVPPPQRCMPVRGPANLLYNGPWNQCPCGYQVGDFLTVVGGTFVTAAQFTVTGINAQTGSVNTVVISNPGNYSVFPISPVSVTGGQGTGATFNITTGLTTIATATVQAGGGPWPAGYRVGDVLQIVGGIPRTPRSRRRRPSQ